MPTVQHSTLTTTDLHEPKGAVTAAANKVYVSDGLGSGAWEHTTHSVHGDMIIAGSTTATAVPIAVDATLSTDSDYVKVVADWTLAHGENVTMNTDEMVIGVAGTYFITFWADVKVPTNNNFIGIKYAINDTAPYSTRKVIGQSVSINDYLNLAAGGVVGSLSVNDTLSVYIAGTKADNLIVQEAGLIAILLHET